MDKEEKIKIAAELYDKIGLTNQTFKISRNDEINADYVWIPNTRGPGALIIGDDGSYLFCQSAEDPEQCEKKYKNGVRSNQ